MRDVESQVAKSLSCKISPEVSAGDLILLPISIVKLKQLTLSSRLSCGTLLRAVCAAWLQLLEPDKWKRTFSLFLARASRERRILLHYAARRWSTGVIYFSRLLAKRSRSRRAEEDASEVLSWCATTATKFYAFLAYDAPSCDARVQGRSCQGRDIGRFEWRLTLWNIAIAFCCAGHMSRARRNERNVSQIYNSLGVRFDCIGMGLRKIRSEKSRKIFWIKILSAVIRFCYLPRSRYIHICVTVEAQWL